MDLTAFFQSVLEQDTAPVVICDTEHTIIYMNPAAIARYQSRGGRELLEKSLKLCHDPVSNEKIDAVLDWFRADPEHNIVYTTRNEKENKDVYMVALRDENRNLIGYYEKHEYRDRENSAFYGVMK